MALFGVLDESHLYTQVLEGITPSPQKPSDYWNGVDPLQPKNKEKIHRLTAGGMAYLEQLNRSQVPQLSVFSRHNHLGSSPNY